MILYSSPKSFDINVVQRASFAIHTYLDMLVFEILNVLSAGKLAALITVQDRWFTVIPDRIFYYP